MSLRNPVLSTTAAASFLLLVGASGAFAQAQTVNQQKCLNSLNKDGSLVAKEQGKANLGCLKGAGKATLPGSAQSCLTADSAGKVAAKQSKTTSDQTKFCAQAPNFG